MAAFWQVCSLIVQGKSGQLPGISEALNGLAGCEVSLSDCEKGTLIVVVEATSSEALLDTITSVRNVAGVLAVSLVYHQQDEQGEETP